MSPADELARIERARDHFDVFGVERRHAVDLGHIESRFLVLARCIHPDFAGTNAGQQARAVRALARLNEAHRVLVDPELRGRYLLELRGLADPTDHSALPGVIAQAVELRDRLEQRQAPAPIIEEVARQRTTVLNSLEDLFLRMEHAEPSDIAPLAAKARTHLNTLRFLRRIIEAAQEVR